MDKKALHKLSYGLYIVASQKDGHMNGQIANTVFQVTAEPAQIAICINKENLTHEYIQISGYFSVSILSKNVPMGFIGKFGFNSGRKIDKFAEVHYKTGMAQMPVVIDYSVASIVAKLVNKIDVGTHTLFIGEVIDTEILSEEEIITYEYYHTVKNGRSPKSAPTYYHEMDDIKEKKKMQKYVCQVCGYIYDPEKGDPDNGVAPGTEFKDLPDNWTCPLCDAGKDQFEEE